MQKLIDKQQAEGREIAPERYNEVFDWRVGVRAHIYTVLPFLVLAIVNYVLFLSWPEDQANILDLVVNILFLPYLQLFAPWLETIDLAITRLCYILLRWIVPAFVMVGYLRGPVYYERKMKEMMKGSKKKRNNARDTQAPQGGQESAGNLSFTVRFALSAHQARGIRIEWHWAGILRCNARKSML